MENALSSIRSSFQKESPKLNSLENLERLRIRYLGRKGALTLILRNIKKLPLEQRKKVGQEANHLRKEIEDRLEQKRKELEKQSRESVLAKERVDISKPVARQEKGHLHPITKILREIKDIFSSLGFEIVEGPEVETEYYNFDALNIPTDHPARDMWDTFWLRSNQKELRTKNLEFSKKLSSNTLSSKLLLRTHTSPVQIRFMEKHNPPIRIVVPGRVYRYEAIDASHDIQFWQLEGLLVDKDVSIASFKAIIKEFFSALFRSKIEVRLRPSYFPFTEPSFEVDVSCLSCRGRGCGLCKKSGWVELAGAGMVHPKVFKAVRYNPQTIQGFAFGMGVDRLAMLKYKIPDIRLFRSGDLRFLRQF